MDFKKIIIGILLIMFGIGFFFILGFMKYSIMVPILFVLYTSISILYLVRDYQKSYLILIFLVLMIQVGINIMPAKECYYKYYPDPYGKDCDCIGIKRYPFGIYIYSGECIGIVTACYNTTYIENITMNLKENKTKTLTVATNTPVTRTKVVCN